MGSSREYGRHVWKVQYETVLVNKELGTLQGIVVNSLVEVKISQGCKYKTPRSVNPRDKLTKRGVLRAAYRSFRNDPKVSSFLKL